jgi:ZIP family zinc transporter
VLEELFLRVAGSNPVMHGLVGGLVIAGFNLLGAMLVLVWRNPSERALDGALGFAAGVMLAASFTSLIIPGIEHPEYGGLYEVLVGILLGVVLLDRADSWVPHVHVLITGKVREDAAQSDGGGDLRNGVRRAAEAKAPQFDPRMASVILFIVAITLHNMPEGLAVGVGFGSGNVGDAIALMLAIGIQNVPEGLAVAIAARNAGLGSYFYAAITGARAGLVEVPIAVFGAWAVSVAGPILPYAMGLAAGGMLYVISDEIIPETHTGGHERIATLGTMAGVVVMLYLDVSLG